MNKFALVLIFSVFAFIKAGVDYFNTEPYHSFDWLDEDEQSFEVKYSSNDNPKFCYLYNQSVVCKPTCTPGANSISCTLAGDSCKADADNPAYKYYYAVYCPTTTDTGYTANSSPDDILNYMKTHSISSHDVGVTIAVCSGSFLKYSMILLSLLIL